MKSGLIGINALPRAPLHDRGMRQDLIRRYSGAAPRYTSYPTAPHFSDTVGPPQYREGLSQLPADEPVSLYLHVPYCDTLCWFCGCHAKITRRYRPVSNYVDTLMQELVLIAQTAPRKLRMSHMHWGGGSPTLLQADDILRLARTAIALFPPARGFEFAVEIDPRETGADRIAALARAGLTRASIGVQDFDPTVQRAINRIQTFAETADVVRNLRDHGIQYLNLDLMYGLPHQSRVRTLSTVRRALELEPARIALFGYAHVPWMKTHQRMIPEEALPGPAERLETFEAAAALLTEAGYVRIGIDHFAKPDDSMAKAYEQGKLRRNFQGYTTDRAETLIGAGASAVSRLPGMYAQNSVPIQRYTAMVREGDLPVEKGVRLTKDDRMRSEIIERIMCDFAVDLGAICHRHGTTIERISESTKQLEEFIRNNLVTFDENILSVQPIGMPFIRNIAACFDKYFVISKKNSLSGHIN